MYCERSWASCMGALNDQVILGRALSFQNHFVSVDGQLTTLTSLPEQARVFAKILRIDRSFEGRLYRAGQMLKGAKGSLNY